ncbi:TIGR03749 family integrating conjugative element protein, partial [Klebsiella pneumoniae]|nr:TIGR03749 family integrating conjugative element protein [Klebsiella pneumoniae]
PVLLVRYAAQNLYAPLRTVEALPGVTPAPVRLAKRITTLLPQQPVTAIPLASWQVNATTVTAIRLQNRSGQRITLDPRELQGQFTAAAFQHYWLGPRGLAEDT